MQIVLALIGLLVGAAVDEWGGAVFGAALGYALGELWILKSRVADLARAVSELRTRSTDAGRVPVQPEAREMPTAARAEVAPSQKFDRPVSQSPVRPETSLAQERTGAPQTYSRLAKPTIPERAELAPVRWIRQFFTGGNTVVRVSIAILFVGVALLLQYASEHGHLPIETRLIGVAFGALVLLVVGWRLRHKRTGYAIALQGGATGILYLTVFAALRAYGVLPPGYAFALLLILVVLSAALAILQDAIWLALLGISGGFLAPILTSTGQGSHIALFSFYAILNVGIVTIAWFKAWRPLNVVGFAFTFVIGVLWGVQQYKAAYFATTEPFLVLFFAMYVAIAIFYASRQEPNLKGYVDGTIVFGVPIAAFSLQSALLYDQRYWLSLSALVVSAMYIFLATVLWKRKSTWKLLSESFVALSVAFATIAIPLALNGRWSAASWALEGAALLWVGCRQSRILPRLAGLTLQFAAAAHFLRDADALFDGLPIVNSTCLGALILAGAGLFCSRLLNGYGEKLTAFERVLPRVLFFWALLWWLVAGVGEIDRRIISLFEPRALLAYFSVTALLCSVIERRMRMDVARWPALALLPVMAIFVSFDWARAIQPLAHFGWMAWPFAWTVFYGVLYRHENQCDKSIAAVLHVGAAWLFSVLVSRELAALIDTAVEGAGSWPAISWAVVPATGLWLLPRLSEKLLWPFAKHRREYAITVCIGFALYLTVWSLFTSVTRDADPYPLPYVPVLNPLDIAQLYVLFTGVVWLNRLPRSIAFPVTTRWSILGGILFAWLNAVLLRTIHYWAKVPYVPEALWKSTLVQSALSIFWTSLALATMVAATKRNHRLLWCVGAGLMAVVVVKLFFIDLSRVGSIARIVSFIGVGLLMLVIGYFAPIPPQKEEQSS